MLHRRALESLSTPQLRGQLVLFQSRKAYSSPSGSSSETADLNAAREWFQRFNKSTLPVKLGKTDFSRSSGPGGQKVNKTSSKATTVWSLHALQGHVPKVLHQGLRTSRYYVSSSDSLSIQCDTSRSQTGNAEETHKRLMEEITQIYRKRVPGITSPEQRQRIEQLEFRPKRGYEKELKLKKWDGTAMDKRMQELRLDKVERKKMVVRERHEAQKAARTADSEAGRLQSNDSKK